LDLLEMVDELALTVDNMGAVVWDACRCSGIIDLSFAAEGYWL